MGLGVYVKEPLLFNDKLPLLTPSVSTAVIASPLGSESLASTPGAEIEMELLIATE